MTLSHRGSAEMTNVSAAGTLVHQSIVLANPLPGLAKLHVLGPLGGLAGDAIVAVRRQPLEIELVAAVGAGLG